MRGLLPRKLLAEDLSARLAPHSKQTLFAEVGFEGVPIEPRQCVRLVADDDFLVGPHRQQEADVVMLVGGLAGSRRNPMHVEVDRELGEPLEVVQTRLLAGFPQRHREDVRVAIRVATELKPTIELPVVGQQEALAIPGYDPRGRRDMTRETGAFEAIGVFANKFANLPDSLGLELILLLVRVEQSEKRPPVHGASIAGRPILGIPG